MIRCHNVTKSFGEFVAVDDVSFEIVSGIGALLGPNGAGKSTLLKLLSGLMAPDSGEVSIAGRLPLEARRLMGVMPDDLGLLSSLTVREHLELAGPIYGLSNAETRQRAESLLRVLGLSGGRDTFLDQCSHGMRKKTSLAMALLHSPRVLLLDEPFEGIDPVSSVAIRDVLLMAAGRGITVLLTSHTLSVVEQLNAQVLMMRNGRVVWNSPADADRRSLEQHYFELIVTPPTEDLTWLRSPQS